MQDILFKTEFITYSISDCVKYEIIINVTFVVKNETLPG